MIAFSPFCCNDDVDDDDDGGDGDDDGDDVLFDFLRPLLLLSSLVRSEEGIDKLPNFSDSLFSFIR